MKAIKNNRNIIRHAFNGFLLISLMALAGCATRPQFTSAEPPTGGKSRIYVYRKSSILGAANYAKIYIDGEFLATLHSGTYGVREVDAGAVIISTLPKASYWGGDILLAAASNALMKESEKLRVRAEPGKTYYIKWAIGDEVSLVDETIGSKEISKLHMGETTDK